MQPGSEMRGGVLGLPQPAFSEQRVFDALRPVFERVVRRLAVPDQKQFHLRIL